MLVALRPKPATMHRHVSITRMFFSLQGNFYKGDTRVAKKRTKVSGPEESVSGYFRLLFEERPELLGSSSNKELFERWLQDHPGEKTVPNRVKSILSNVKSIVRKKRRKKAGRKKAAELPTLVAPQASTVPLVRLEALEEQIDHCLTHAKRLDREGLADIIVLLRRARNGVVWKIGQ
jgi:hypothetical protein